MRLNFETKTKLFVATLGLVVVAIIAGAILPTARDIYGINRDTLNLKNFLEQKYKNAQNLRQSSNLIDDVKKQVDAFGTALYHRGDELKLITFLENIAAENKLTQRIQAPNLDKPENKTANLSLSLNGDYHNIFEYLSDLERAPYFLTVNQLQISAASERGRQIALPGNVNNVNLDIEIQLYVAD